MKESKEGVRSACSVVKERLRSQCEEREWNIVKREGEEQAVWKGVKKDSTKPVRRKRMKQCKEGVRRAGGFKGGIKTESIKQVRRKRT